MVHRQFARAPTVWLALLLWTHNPAHKIPISHSKASTKTTRLTRTRSLYLSLRQKARYLSTAIAVVVMRETDAITKAITVVGDTNAQYKDGTSTMVANIRPKCKGTTTKPTQRSDDAKLQKRALEGGCIDWLLRSATKVSVFPIEAAKNTRTSSTQIKRRYFLRTLVKRNSESSRAESKWSCCSWPVDQAEGNRRLSFSRKELLGQYR